MFCLFFGGLLVPPFFINNFIKCKFVSFFRSELISRHCFMECSICFDQIGLKPGQRSLFETFLQIFLSLFSDSHICASYSSF